MTRKKVKLAYISNDSARKATFKKRKKGLLKKVNELSTLCDVEACAVIYSPYDSQAEVYPTAPGGVQRVLARFRKMPEMDQSKKMVNQESFLRQRIAKAAEQLKKLRKENREKEITRLMFRALTATSASRVLHGLGVVDLNDLGWVVEQNLKDVAKRIERLEGKRPAKEEPVAAGREATRLQQPLLPPPGWKERRSGEAAAKKVEEEEKKKMKKKANVMTIGAPQQEPTEAAELGGKSQQWFMELMMSHQGHHEKHIMNFGYGGGDGSSGGASHWETNRVFP